MPYNAYLVPHFYSVQEIENTARVGVGKTMAKEYRIAAFVRRAAARPVPYALGELGVGIGTLVYLLIQLHTRDDQLVRLVGISRSVRGLQLLYVRRGFGRLCCRWPRSYRGKEWNQDNIRINQDDADKKYMINVS